jgi:hypothetical protein
VAEGDAATRVGVADVADKPGAAAAQVVASANVLSHESEQLGTAAADFPAFPRAA